MGSIGAWRRLPGARAEVVTPRRLIAAADEQLGLIADERFHGISFRFVSLRVKSWELAKGESGGRRR